MNKKGESLFYKAVSYTVVVFILWYLAQGLYRDWSKIKIVDFDFSIVYFLLSIVFTSSSLILYGLIWRKIISLVSVGDASIGRFEAVKIYTYSQFGRYLPGKVWTYLGQTYLATRAGVDKRLASLSLVYEILLTVSISFLLPLLILNFTDLNPWFDNYIIVLTIIAFTILFIHPKIFYSISNRLAKKLKLPIIEKTMFLNYRQLAHLFFLYCLAMLINGVGFYFFINAFFYLTLDKILIVAAIFILASALGMVALFAPGGLGVREGSLALLLQPMLFEPLNIFISLVSRVWITFIEIILVGLLFVLDKLRSSK